MSEQSLGVFSNNRQDQNTNDSQHCDHQRRCTFHHLTQHLECRCSAQCYITHTIIRINDEYFHTQNKPTRRRKTSVFSETAERKCSRVSFCDGSFYDDSLLRPLSSRTEHSRLVMHHCRNSSSLSLLIALLDLFRCTRVSSFYILVRFF